MTPYLLSAASALRESIAGIVEFLVSHWEWLALGAIVILVVLLLGIWGQTRTRANRRQHGLLARHLTATNPASSSPQAPTAPPSQGLPQTLGPRPIAAALAADTTRGLRQVSPPLAAGPERGSADGVTPNGPTTAPSNVHGQHRPRGRRSLLPAPKAVADPLWGPTTPLDTDPALGKELGSGGQGTVHAVKGDPSRVYKTLASPVEGALDEYLRFVSVGASLHIALEDANVDLVWPEAPRVDPDTGAITGYLMPRIPNGYTVTVRGAQKEAHLAHALPKEGPFRPDVVPDVEQRIALVRAVGQFLDALHRHDYVYGDISWSNILYRLEPKPTVLVFDLDGARRLGRRPVLASKALDTLDWADHADSSALGAGFDSDRYKYALLVYRMLVSRHVSAALPAEPTIAADAGLPPDMALRLGALLRRAAAGAGGRPAVSEWLSALNPELASVAR